jgi:hypothetical protein
VSRRNHGFALEWPCSQPARSNHLAGLRTSTPATTNGYTRHPPPSSHVHPWPRRALAACEGEERRLGRRPLHPTLAVATSVRHHAEQELGDMLAHRSRRPPGTEGASATAGLSRRKIFAKYPRLFSYTNRDPVFYIVPPNIFIYPPNSDRD